MKVDFGHGALEFGEVKERVVAKAASAARSIEDDSFDGTVGGVLNATIARGDKYAMVSGIAALRGNVSQALKENDVVPDIGVVVGIRRVDEAGVGCESGRTDSGRAVQGVYFETGVIGEDEFARRKLGVVDGLDGGVRGERVAVLFGSFDVRQTRQGFETDGVGFGCGLKIAQLSLAGCGNV